MRLTFFSLGLCLIGLPSAFAGGFAATDFFETIVPGQLRQEGLPERVTFDAVAMTEADLKTELLGTFKVSGACSGRPVSDKRAIEGANVPDGYYDNGLALAFHSINDVVRINYRAKSTLTPEDSQLRFDREPMTCANGFDEQKQALTLKCEPFFVVIEFRPVRIRETGETVFIDDSPQRAQVWRRLCPEGETPQAILSAVPST